MSLSIRHWLIERHIEISQLGVNSAQVSGIAFRIAQEMELLSMGPFAISSLTEVLELPLQVAWQVAPGISQLSVGLLRILSRKKSLKRNEGTWLAFQVAYLDALKGILVQESQLRRPWVNRAEVLGNQAQELTFNEPQLSALLKTLRPGRLSDSQAEQALSLVADSFLVQQMNNLAIAWFVANGAEEMEAKLLTQRLSNGLSGHLLTVIAENALPLAQLQKFVRLGNLSNFPDTDTQESIGVSTEMPTATRPLDLDREYYRAKLLRSLSKPLFAEPFSLKDIYIPLKGKVVSNHPGGPPTSAKGQRKKIVDLMVWAMSQLEDRNSIAVIEAEPGCGKTSFCQMWASQVAIELYPRWMPVVIQLRDVSLGQTFEQTLESALPLGRFSDADGWLSSSSPPCLLILDGLDELPRSPHKSSHLWTFLDQVMRFHHQYLSSSGKPRHKVLLTSRSVTLDGLTRKYRQKITLPLPAQLQRIAIEPMAQEEFRQWFNSWAKLQSKSITQSYFTFLKHGRVFQPQPSAQALADLVCRPLMLYLVGILHRDGLVDKSVFQMTSSQLKFEIYDSICRWLLGEPTMGSGSLPELIREGIAHASRSQEAISNLLESRHPQQLRLMMQKAALTIVQTGQYQAPQAAIEKHLISESSEEVLPIPLPHFFFHRIIPESTPRLSVNQDLRVKSKIEFSHSNLGEYLAAEEIALQLKALTQKLQNQYGEVSFIIDDGVKVAEHLYALLGYGLLSNKIEELVIERLRREEQRNINAFSFQVLFKRLYSFYQAYCRGRWLDEGIAQQAHAQLQSLQNPLNVLQIDASVGLNVFILLCSGAQEADIPFWPCGNPDIPQEFDAEQLLSFMGRTAVLSTTAFWERARQNLCKLQLLEARLNGAILVEANLRQANLSAAELIEINLAGANLQNANLSSASLAGANLSAANLFRASLEGADLSGANLKGANLTGSNLSNACLFEAQLNSENRKFAENSGAIFSLEEFQEHNRSMAPQKPTLTPEDELLSEEDTAIFIETAAGEPMLPEEPYSYSSDDYEGETVRFDDEELGDSQDTVLI
ncbi:MAG: NACHT domain-containing protein [Symploca sp. SIO2C1]|nr:NACHT domain-containing protein [Symploca sp. SIO2C1]